MPWSTRPSAPAGGRVTTELLDAMNDQIELLSKLECTLLSDHAGVTSNTTLGSAGTTTNLSRTTIANQRYRFYVLCFYSAATAGDFKPGLSLPSGSLIRYRLVSLPATTDTNVGDTYYGTETTFGLLSAPGQTTASSIISCVMEGVVSIGSTGGSLQFVYAQAASSATATILRAGSCMRIEPLDGV